MKPSDVRHTLEHLVEAQRDHTVAVRELDEYQANEGEPAAPSVFDDLDAFLAFYGQRERFRIGLDRKETAVRTAYEAYQQAAALVGSVLPRGSRLFYTYQGDRRELQDVTFTIENQDGRIVILGSAGPVR